MRPIAIGVAMIVAFGWASVTAHAQSWKPPAESQRCPSKWGAGDERGSGNHMKPESVLRATQLIKTGEVIDLAHVLGPSGPFSGTSPRLARISFWAGNGRSSIRGMRTARLGARSGCGGMKGRCAGGSCSSGLGCSIEYSHYNCFKTDEISTRGGFTKLGIEKVGTLITRGVLIDIAALKGVETLPDTYEITPQDLQQALQRQNLRLQPGDAVLINTGWNKLWNKDNARYVKSCPGIGVAAAEWLAKQDPMLVGADNWPVEVAPNPDAQLSLPVHQILLVVNGIHLLENAKLDELVAKKAYEFAFVMQPLKIYGASGSTVAPAAIR